MYIIVNICFRMSWAMLIIVAIGFINKNTILCAGFPFKSAKIYAWRFLVAKSVQELSNPIGCLQNESSLDKGAIELLAAAAAVFPLVAEIKRKNKASRMQTSTRRSARQRLRSLFSHDANK